VPNEIDRQLLPGFIQKSFAISLGGLLKTVDMMKHPARSLKDLTSELKSLATPPPDSGRGLKPKAQAIASNWVMRGMSIVEECRVAGEKLTD
jgi:hypothetical protein